MSAEIRIRCRYCHQMFVAGRGGATVCRETRCRDLVAWNARKNRNWYRKAQQYNLLPYVWIDFVPIFVAYGWQCQQCFRALTIYDEGDYALVADHRIPLARGGSNTADNAQPMCHKCNQVKSDDMPAAVLRQSLLDFDDVSEYSVRHVCDEPMGELDRVEQIRRRVEEHYQRFLMQLDKVRGLVIADD